jgi:AcrR family transcriptional regulator
LTRASIPTHDFTPRQNEVLEVALRLLVEGGEQALTTAGLARAANCSKESLYKWFGDREGLLAAMIAFQAAKVRTLAPGRKALGPAEFRRHLTVFAGDLLAVLSGEVSIALNRLAIGQASRDGSRLGKLVLDRGRRTIMRVYYDRDADLNLIKARRSPSSATAARAMPTR